MLNNVSLSSTCLVNVSKKNLHFDMFRQRVEIVDTCSKERWTLKRLLAKHPSRPFNPLIADAFFRAGYIEAWGRGIEKINRECVAHGIKSPVYDSGMSGLMLTFQANPAHLRPASAEGRLGEKLGETRTAIIRTMLANPRVTTVQLAKLLSISTTAVEKNLHFLKTHRLIERIGPAKGGHWKVRDSGT